MHLHPDAANTLATVLEGSASILDRYAGELTPDAIDCPIATLATPAELAAEQLRAEVLAAACRDWAEAMVAVWLREQGRDAA